MQDYQSTSRSDLLWLYPGQGNQLVTQVRQISSIITYLRFLTLNSDGRLIWSQGSKKFAIFSGFFFPPRRGRILSFFFPLVLAVLSFHPWSGFKLKHPFCTCQGVKKQTASKYSQKFWVTLKIYSSNTHTHTHTHTHTYIYICTHIHFTIWNLYQTSFENCLHFGS